MHIRNVPALDARYWVAISLASVFGANTGDFVSHVLGLGHMRGLPVLAAIFTVILLLERRTRSGTDAYYWLAIVTVRTAATNLADLATHDLHLNYQWVLAGLATLLLLILFTGRASSAPPTANGRQAGSQGLPATDTRYWMAMLTAGTLGTALGDFAAGGLGLAQSAVIFSTILAVVLVLRSRAELKTKLVYWLAIVVVRTAGTNLADFLAGKGGLNFGLVVSTTITGLLLLSVVLLGNRLPAMRRARGVTPPG